MHLKFILSKISDCQQWQTICILNSHYIQIAIECKIKLILYIETNYKELNFKLHRYCKRNVSEDIQWCQNEYCQK